MLYFSFAIIMSKEKVPFLLFLYSIALCSVDRTNKQQIKTNLQLTGLYLWFFLLHHWVLLLEACAVVCNDTFSKNPFFNLGQLRHQCRPSLQTQWTKVSHIIFLQWCGDYKNTLCGIVTILSHSIRNVQNIIRSGFFFLIIRMRFTSSLRTIQKPPMDFLFFFKKTLCSVILQLKFSILAWD